MASSDHLSFNQYCLKGRILTPQDILFSTVDHKRRIFHTRNHPKVLDQKLTEDFEPFLRSIKCKGPAIFEVGGWSGGGGGAGGADSVRFVSKGRWRSVSEPAADVAEC